MLSTEQMFSAGKAHGEGRTKADEVLQLTADKASDIAQSSHESSVKATGFLQQAKKARYRVHNSAMTVGATC